MEYQEFLLEKAQMGSASGFKTIWMPDCAFDFQRSLMDWAIWQGRGLLLADCGMGKTLMGLTFAENVVRKTNKPVLYLTPFAVGSQTVKEAEKFGIDAIQSRDGNSKGNIIVTNYEKLHLFNHADFGGCVCDESSILKSFNGARKNEITEFMKKIPYRLLQTATAAPNDFIELGTSSEALGYLGYMDMLNKFFKNDLNNSASGRMRGEVIKWRLKGHAELPFWRWVCSWARAVRKPSDIGFSDDSFVLPELIENQHLVESETLPDGYLLPLPAVGLKEQREEKRRTIVERCEKAAEIANTVNDFSTVWCHLNDEGDLLEKLIPGSVQISGKDSDEKKEEKINRFLEGDAKTLITKPKIGAWGLNFQHCNRVIEFPTHSFEQHYQLIRRCWRFGQKRPVIVDLIITEGEKEVLKNMQRKAHQAEEMFSNLVAQMNNAISLQNKNKHTKQIEVPKWL